MTTASRSRGILLAPVCLALCLVFASLIYLELDQQAEGSPGIAAADERPPAKPSVAPQEAPPEAVVFAMPARTAYNEVLERPPFSEMRRPAPAGAAETAVDQPIVATVIGTIVSASGVRALIEHGEPAQLARVVEGQEIEGWTVKSILKDKVVLTRSGSTIELKVKGNPNQATAPSMPTPQPARSGAAKPLNAASPIRPAYAAKALANASAAVRPVEPSEAAAASPVSDSTLSQMTGSASRSGGTRGISMRSGGRRG